MSGFRTAACAAIAFVAASSPCFAAVYRCVENGQTVYSDRPCPGGARASEVKVDPAPPAPSPAALDALRFESEANAGHLIVGQSARQVERAWGAPARKNIDTTKTGRREQWIYERPGGTIYVYVQDGLLSSVSERQDPNANISTVRTRTRAELEADDRAAKAGERKFVRPGASKSDVAGRVGVPESVTFTGGQECWYYSVTPKDQQTNTRYCFNGDRVFDVDRGVQR